MKTRVVCWNIKAVMSIRRFTLVGFVLLATFASGLVVGAQVLFRQEVPADRAASARPTALPGSTSASTRCPEPGSLSRRALAGIAKRDPVWVS